MGEGLYLWSKTHPGQGWRKVATKVGMSGWRNHLWFSQAMTRRCPQPRKKGE